jgi:NADPH:quinone reductase-like Zn-dependent oxidoreductase
VIVEPDHNGLEALSALVQSGKLQVHVEHVFRLTEVAQAHRLLTGRTKERSFSPSDRL